MSEFTLPVEFRIKPTFDVLSMKRCSASWEVGCQKKLKKDRSILGLPTYVVRLMRLFGLRKIAQNKM